MIDLFFIIFILCFIAALAATLGAAATGERRVLRFAYIGAWIQIGLALAFLLSGSWGTHGSASEGLAWAAWGFVGVGVPAAAVVGLVALALVFFAARDEGSDED